MTDLFFVNKHTAIHDINQNGSYDDEDKILNCSYSAVSAKNCNSISPADRTQIEKRLQDLNILIPNQSRGLAEISFQSNRALLEKYARAGNLEDTQLILNRLENLAADHNLPFDQEWASAVMGESVARYLGFYDHPSCRPGYSSELTTQIVKSARELIGIPMDETTWTVQWLQKIQGLKECMAEF